MPKLVSFQKIFDRAAKRKGGPELLEEMLGDPPKSARALARTKDDRWLASMTQGVFSAGFVWKVVENKWPSFEEAFHGFEVDACASLDDEGIAALTEDTRVIRNRSKLIATRDNALFVQRIAEEHKSFGRFVSQWPSDDVTGLWDVMKTGGSRLGGNTGQYLLRRMGKDTFMLTSSVVAALTKDKVIDGSPTSKKRLAAVQAAFNSWAAETGRPMAHLSRVVAFSVP
jgi:3-methyladenine DNA glycosylase Tag